VSLENTHPFTLDKRDYLIHNGIINNSSSYIQSGQCDSLAILERYKHYRADRDLKKLDSVVSDLTGYMAIMVLNPNTLTTYRDSTAQLYFADIPTVGEVTCTSDDIILAICDRLKLKKPKIFALLADTASRLSLQSGYMAVTGVEKKYVYSGRSCGSSAGTEVGYNTWPGHDYDGYNSCYPPTYSDDRPSTVRSLAEVTSLNTNNSERSALNKVGLQ
jgi:hypothetical protein